MTCVEIKKKKDSWDHSFALHRSKERAMEIFVFRVFILAVVSENRGHRIYTINSLSPKLVKCDAPESQ